MFEKHAYNKKFSLGHWDGCVDDNIYLQCLENSSEQYRNEIYDIYFGATFKNDDVQYGNCMGLDCSEGAYKNLLKIQEKYGIPISLTFNDMNRPVELLDHWKDFVKAVKKYYDDGVRSCTISHTHLMRIGELQSAFPDMNWKNTVNHRITATQSFVDYVKLGYTTVQLDRDFNRNLPELKRVKKEADRLGVRTCLLVREGCMPECPFKMEHDCWQSGALKDADVNKKGLPKHFNYWGKVNFTCSQWRKSEDLLDLAEVSPSRSPRLGTDVTVHDKNDWDDFAMNCDIFKISGRLTTRPPHLQDDIEKKFIYGLEIFNKEGAASAVPPGGEMVIQSHSITTARQALVVDSFKEIYENNLTPVHKWLEGHALPKNKPVITNIDSIKQSLQNHFWNKPKAITLQKLLKSCRNQCYKCHKCDELFNKNKELESILDL
jgi:hypothetical protein|tara:strand:+ start:1242 stop:2540 length:1299 start_codon:yes stop_codon:yes gene_type:complete